MTLVPAAGATSAASLPGPALPAFDRPAQISVACEGGLKGARQRVAASARIASSVRWKTRAGDLSGGIEDHAYPISFVAAEAPARPAPA